MAAKPYFLWGNTHGAAASDSADVAVFGSSAPETTAPLAAATAGDTAALVSPDLGAAAVARPRLRRSSAGNGKQQQQVGGGGGAARKPPQRGLGVAELERLRCGGDPLREFSATVGVGDAAAAAAAAQAHSLLHYHHHLQVPPASAFDPAPGPAARYCSQLLAPAPPPPAAGPVCFLHPPVAPEQQYFRDRWARLGCFSPAGAGGGAADHQSYSSQLLPAPLATEHPSSQSTIWRPAVTSSSSSSACLHAGHRCDICSRRMKAMTERGAVAPTPPACSKADANTNTMPAEYSIYDLAAAMATARQGQGDAFLARDRKRGAAEAEAPAKKEVREIEFFPAASAHQTRIFGGQVPVPDESELAVPCFSSPYGAAAGHTDAAAAPQLDLSLRL